MAAVALAAVGVTKSCRHFLTRFLARLGRPIINDFHAKDGRGGVSPKLDLVQEVAWILHGEPNTYEEGVKRSQT